MAVDLAGFALCAALAFWVTASFETLGLQFTLLIASSCVLSVAAAMALGLYKSIVRYVGLDLLKAALKVAVVAAVSGGAVAALVVENTSVAKTVVALWAFSAIYVVASRYIARAFLLGLSGHRTRERVVIYGAGAAAAELIPSLLVGNNYVPVALVDDSPDLFGKKVKGVEVHSPDAIETLIHTLDATRVLLAMPEATRRKRRQILERLSLHPVHVQTVPDLGDIMSGKARVDDIHDVDVDDLLGRDPVPPNQALLKTSIHGKSVMVTGAGGSIGSELCRQIIGLCPDRLILVEISEPALYAIDHELQEIQKTIDCDCEIIPLLGSVHHRHRLTEVIRAFNVKKVFHAAAYKHVPIVEQNVFEGIHNNVLGTLHAARAAIAGGADSFILISTDKAVNPTNVMGATKRFAELILQALDAEEQGTSFSMVRFGNVLESSGSVVPLFKKQIREGGPVTVTHRDIIRYFMTIPEAAQLVIQAGAMAQGGDVFVLDMGKPVKILDLAHRMINLMGLTIRNEESPEGDIDIKFVGLRPAEKLYEELLIGSNVTGTDHPRIMRAHEDQLSMDELSGYLDEINAASSTLDFEKARTILLSAVKEYNPQNDIDDLVWTYKKAAGEERPADGGVIDFPRRT